MKSITAIPVVSAFLVVLSIVSQPHEYAWSIPSIPTSTGPRGDCYDAARTALNNELYTIQRFEKLEIDPLEEERDEAIERVEAGIKASKSYRNLPIHIKALILAADVTAVPIIESYYGSKIADIKFKYNASRGGAGKRARSYQNFCRGLPTTYAENDENGTGGMGNSSWESNPIAMFRQDFNWMSYFGISNGTTCSYKSIPQRC